MEEKEEKIETNVKETEEQKENIKTEVEEVVKEENKEIDEIKEKETENKEADNKETDKKENTKEEKHVKHEEKKSLSVKSIIYICILTVLLLFASTIFAILNMNNLNIINGIYIENVNVSNLNVEEVNKLINEKISKIENIEISYGEFSEIVKINDLGIQIDCKKAIDNAINVGRSNNILIDNYQILKANIFKTTFDLDIAINEEKFKDAIKNTQAEIPNAVKEYSYEIDNDKLIITNGKPGIAIEVETLKNKIIENLKEQFNSNKKVLELPIKSAEPEKINIEKIHDEIYKEAKDAYIVEDPFELHKEENGVDLNITIQEAKKLLEEEKETYTIPLKITKPRVKVKDLGDKLFKQTLSKYTTIYDAGNYNRSHNLALAAKTINGTILLPGETFSYNGTLGNTNAAKGYKQATAYVGGKVVPSYGGGICQVSSTLYNAVLYANLEIVERYNHSYAVNYVPAGRDATVAYGGKDFKFKNTRKYPIKIVASAKNGVVSISISGIKEEKEYDVVLTSTVLSTKANSTTYEKTSSLPEGTEKVIQKGYTGKTSIAYKILKYNGKTISKTVLSKDTYKPMNRIIQVGTKKVTTNTTSKNNANTSTQTSTTPTPNNTTVSTLNTTNNI